MSAVRAVIGKLTARQTRSLGPISLFLFVAALFVLFSLTVHLRLWTGFDLTTTLFLERQVPRSLDPSLSIFSLIGSAEVTGLLILAYAFFFCPPGTRLRLVALFLLIAFFEWIGKNIVYQPGPPHIFHHSVLPISFPSTSVKTPFSFPSGHSARSVFVTFVLVAWIWQSQLGARAKRTLLGLLAVGEIVMLVTRVSLGEHWCSDVIGGALLATALVLPWLFSKPAPFPRLFRSPPSSPRSPPRQSRRADSRRASDGCQPDVSTSP